MDFADAFAHIKAELGAESRQSEATIKLTGGAAGELAFTIDAGRM